jgi:nucleotide-binding universal stress UspA family protein
VSTPAEGPILICFDRSDGARRAIETAGALFAGRKAVVLHVWRPLTVVAAEYGGTVSLPDDEGGALEKLAQELAAEGARLAAAAGLDATPAIAEGAYEGTSHAIVETAHARGAAVIVIGARGLSTFKSFVLGSVSHGVAQHAHVPVLIVPPAEA